MSCCRFHYCRCQRGGYDNTGDENAGEGQFPPPSPTEKPLATFLVVKDRKRYSCIRSVGVEDRKGMYGGLGWLGILGIVGLIGF